MGNVPGHSRTKGETLQSQEGQGDFYQTVDRLYNSHLSRLQTVIYQILIISRLVFMSLSVTFTSQLLTAIITSPGPFLYIDIDISLYYILYSLFYLAMRSPKCVINM